METKVQQNQLPVKQLFVGMDVHKKSWTVTLLTDLFEHKTFAQTPSVDHLAGYIDKRFPGYTVQCAYEACFCGFWIKRQLEEKGYECLVVNPSDIPTTDKENTNKEDKRDSRKIARQLRSGHLTGIQGPDRQREQFRSLFRQRNTLVKDLRRKKSQIKSLLLYYGISIPVKLDNASWSRNFVAWLKEMEFEHPTGKECLQSMIRQLEFLRKELLHAGLLLRGYCRKHYERDYYLLRSIPGIGPLVAIALLSEVGDIRRFRNIEQLCSYIGLVPSIYASGQTKINRGITPRSKVLLRSYLIESAWVAVRLDPGLTDYYRKYSGKMHTNKSIVKVTRKLIARIYHVIKTGEKYKYNTVV